MIQKISFSVLIFFLLLFSLDPSTVEASSFFSEILQNLGIKKTETKTVQIKVQYQTVEKKVSVEKDGKTVGSAKINTETGDTKLKTPQGEMQINVANPETALDKIFSGLGINQNSLQPQTNPFLNTPLIQNSPLGNILTNPNFPAQINKQMGGAGQGFGNQGLGGFIQNIFGPGGPQKAIAGLSGSNIFGGLVSSGAAQDLATPYNGPGGALPGECGVPQGPIAFNIGGKSGNGVSCNAKTIFVGFNQNFRNGFFGGGYANPMLEKGMSAPGATVSNCKNPQTAQEYNEKCFSDYSGGEAQSYIQKQFLHWQEQGEKAGQKCVPVYLDNCDSIGSKNYKIILDSIEQLNNSGKVKIKIINPNPHLSTCNFLSHPAVIGALAELDGENNGPETVQKVSRLRNKPEQTLIVTRGGKGTDANLREAAKENVSNASFSFDVTVNGAREYQKIYNCTYK